MTEPLLCLAKLSAAYADDPDRHPAIRDVDFSVRFGERAILIGPNGSGKSTLLRTIMSQESIQILGGSISWHPEFVLSNGQSTIRIGYVPQRLEDSLFFDLSVSENIFIALMLGRRRRPVLAHNRITQKNAFELAVQSFPKFASFESTLVRQLSGGWQAVLALAMAFLRRPDLLILDEVTANLDSRNAALLWETLDNLFQNQQRMAILMVSHDLKFAKHTATTALFMRAGQLVKTIGNIELANTSFDDFLKEYHTACWG